MFAYVFVFECMSLYLCEFVRLFLGHLWAGVVRVGHGGALRDQRAGAALLLVLPCNHGGHQGECSDDYGDCGDHDGDSGDNNDDLGMMVMSEVKTDYYHHPCHQCGHDCP